MSIKRNSALAFAPQALAIATGIVTSVVTARTLGPEGRGVLSLILLALAVLAIVGDLGMGAAVTYSVSKKRLLPEEALGFCVLGSLFSSLTVVGIAIIAWPAVAGSLMQGVSSATFLISLSAVPALLFVSLRTRMEMALNRFKTTTLHQTVQTLGLLTANVVVLLVVHRGVHELVVAIAFIWIASALGMFASSFRAHGIAFRIPLAALRETLSYGFRSYAGGVVYYATLRMDSFILNAYTGNAAVGQYTMATTLTEKLWLIDSSIGQATMPEVVSRDRESAAQLLAATSRTVSLLVLVIGGTLFAFAPLVIGGLYGQEFMPAVVLLRILLPGVMLYSVSRVLNQFYVGQLGRPEVSSAVALVVAGVGLTLYFTLVPPFGYVGAALASSLTYSFNFMIDATLFKRATKIRIRTVLVPTREEVVRMRTAIAAIMQRAQR